MSPYNITPQEEKYLKDYERELYSFLFEPEEPKGSTPPEENGLYGLIWNKVWPVLLNEHAMNCWPREPWYFFRWLEKNWNIQAPHPHAFQALAQLPMAGDFEPQGFIQTQHQKLLPRFSSRLGLGGLRNVPLVVL
jgi:hypothetical protein